MTETTVVLDPFDPRQAVGATGLLAQFNDAGVLVSADVHVAVRLGALRDETDEAVLLAVALAVRGPRLGHVFVDLATVADTAVVESEVPVDLAALPWPAIDAWMPQVAASVLVAVAEPEAGGGDGGDARPLRLIGTHLYLDRYWREERRLAADLRAFGKSPADGVDGVALRAGLQRLFAGAEGDGRQELAAASAVLRRLSVVAGGPGTGKTTTVAQIVALLLEQAHATGAPPPLIALAAPTGKAAARLEEAIHSQAATLAVDEETRATLLALSASTLHRLLGWLPGSHSRFRHNRLNRLPHDVVIVDETSMVSLSLMGRLVEAVRPEARLVLVGDPGQLTSIEAGAVLGDIVGPSRDGLTMSPGAHAALAAAVDRDVAFTEAPQAVTIGDGIVVLDHIHRFGGAIAELATAIRVGDPDRVIELLDDGGKAVTWLPIDVAETGRAAIAPVHDGAVDAGRAVIDAARAGNAPAALHALGAFRILCAHRRGPYGAATWMTNVERWLAEAVPTTDFDAPWYPGRPLLVTENDYSLKLYNGDTGVVITTGPDRVAAAFERSGGTVEFSPTRLGAVDTVYAMTVHKSQGSQFGTTAVLLPPVESPVLSREWLYTAVTRASERLVVVGTEAAVRGAVARPAARASGLRERLWGATLGQHR